MPVGRIVWAATLAIVGALELYGIRHPRTNFTFSELTRWAFRTDRPAGRHVFRGVVAGLGVWFVRHILSTPGSLPPREVPRPDPGTGAPGRPLGL